MFQKSLKDVLDLVEEEIQPLVEQYFQNRIQELDTLKQALHENDFETIKKRGHRLKGNARTYGFIDLEGLGERLEQSAQNQDHRLTEELIQSIEDYLKGFEEFSSSV